MRHALWPEGKCNARSVTHEAEVTAMDSQREMIFNRVGVRDPQVDNIEGASLLVPEGWTLTGGFYWMPTFALQVNFLAQVTDPVTGASVFMLPVQQFVWAMQQAVPMAPGTNWLGSVLYPPPRDAFEFVRLFYLPGPLQHLAHARVVQVEDLPKYAEAVWRTLGDRRGVRVTRLRHAYEWGGRAWEEDVYVTLVCDPPGAITMWWGEGYAMRAPAGELDRMRPILSVPVRSVRFSLDWEATRDYVRDLFRKNVNDTIIRTAQWGHLVRQYREELSQAHRQVWAERQAAQDRQSFALREVLGGIETFKNPFDSHTVEVPAGYQQQWVNPQGQVILSNNPMYDPRPGSNVDWRNMERYKPG
jgi:hypothetical protein